MIPFLVAVLVLVIVGTLLWKVMAAQAAEATRDGHGSGTDAPTGPTRTAHSARPRRTRPVAPDDDPEFLRSLDDHIRRPDRDDPPTS